jgi:hypothetical protein
LLILTMTDRAVYGVFFDGAFGFSPPRSARHGSAKPVPKLPILRCDRASCSLSRLTFLREVLPFRSVRVTSRQNEGLPSGPIPRLTYNCLFFCNISPPSLFR